MYRKDNWTIFQTGTGAICKDIVCFAIIIGLPQPYLIEPCTGRLKNQQTHGLNYRQKYEMEQ